MTNKCHFCKKEYETYPVLMCSDIECFLMEQHIKLIYYDRERKEGVCKECREKEFSDPIWRIRAWLNVRAELQCKLIDFIEKKDKKMINVGKKALLRIEKIEKKLEKTPEVKALYRKNNPAMFKKSLKNTKCTYCSECNGEVWINNPNYSDFQKTKCWWVCKICEEVIGIQQELTFASMFGNSKRAEKLNNRLLEISKENNIPIINAQIEKVEDQFEIYQEGELEKVGSKYESSCVEFTGTTSITGKTRLGK